MRRFEERVAVVLGGRAGIGLATDRFSPLGKGFLTGKIDEHTSFDPTDSRNTKPRFSPENRKANQALVELLEGIAHRRGATPAQIPPAWLLAQNPWIVPVPGTTERHRLQENVAAAAVELTADELRDLESAASRIAVHGCRCPGEPRARAAASAPRAASGGRGGGGGSGSGGGSRVAGGAGWYPRRTTYDRTNDRWWPFLTVWCSRRCALP